MKVSIENGDKVLYRKGKTSWTVIETPEKNNRLFYKLVNATGEKHKLANDYDLRLILEIEPTGNFGIFVKEI